MPALGQGDRSNDHPQYGSPYEVKGHEGHSCYLQRAERINDIRGEYETRVHEHRYEQTPGTVVYPHHEHPEGNQE
jgi:hypothetical protein